MGGEYIPQRAYQYMKRPEGVVGRGRERNDIACVRFNGAKNVPRMTWEWMERMVMDEDKSTRSEAQDILKPRDTRMTYLVAVLKEGRSDTVGRSLRMTRIRNYSETRPYNPREHDGGDQVKEDKGRIHTKMKWGWKLYRNMMTSFDKET